LERFVNRLLEWDGMGEELPDFPRSTDATHLGGALPSH
jgi:hypothetical protein